jgi:hypothetical protein
VAIGGGRFGSYSWGRRREGGITGYDWIRCTLLAFLLLLMFKGVYFPCKAFDVVGEEV